jgi:hypothetical protein
MSLIYRTYACDGPDDESSPHTFELLIERDQHPKFCPLCGVRFEDEPEPIPGGFAIGGSAAARSVDQTYSLLEESSAVRAQLAEEAGVPSAQARSLKVTDLKDNLREGDVAAKIPAYPNNPVGQFMQQAEQVGIKYGWQRAQTPGGGNYNGPTTSRTGQRVSGPANDALGAVQGDSGFQHQQTRAEMARRGELWAAIGNKRVR